MVAVDSRAIIITLNAAGSQSNTLCKTGCSLKWSIVVIIKGVCGPNEITDGRRSYLNTARYRMRHRLRIAPKSYAGMNSGSQAARSQRAIAFAPGSG